MRKVIQIAASAASCDYGLNESLFALCNDGTVWSLKYASKGWTRCPDIPQPMCSYYKERIDELLVKDREVGLDEEEKEEYLSLSEEYKRIG